MEDSEKEPPKLQKGSTVRDFLERLKWELEQDGIECTIRDTPKKPEQGPTQEYEVRFFRNRKRK